MSLTATGIFLHNPLPPCPPVNTVPTMTDNGTESWEKLEQTLKLCENKGIQEADAQILVDRLDQRLNEQLDPPEKRRLLISLMTICKVYCIVPTSHLVVETELKKLGDAPFKNDEFSNLWAGIYGDQEVSIRVLSRYESDDVTEIKRRLCHEAVAWKRISHPKILPLIGITLSNEVAVVSPWMENGDVLDYLRENDEANPVKLLEEAVHGLQYLHELGIVHGDLQGRHILVNDDGHACLANVGHASIVREQGDPGFPPAPENSNNRNLRYLPPGNITDGAASELATRQGDIYSMGMTIYEVLTDKKPFHEYNPWSVVMQIIKGARPKKPDFAISRGYTEELWELTTECWWPDPAKRTTVDHLLEVLRNAALEWKPRENAPSVTDDMDY